MPDTEGKYVVFKRKEFDAWYEEADLSVPSLPRPLADCVVIRHDDMFAATAFYAYAGTVQSAIEVLEALGAVEARGEWEKMLRPVADFFTAQAERAELTPNKHLPKGD